MFRVVIIGFLLLALRKCYKPVILLHGTDMGAVGMDFLKEVIQNEHPGTDVVSIPFYEYNRSSCTLFDQVEYVMNQIIITRTNRSWDDGYHLIGFSQGGLVGRVTLSRLPDHECDTFISLAGVQLGHFHELESWLSHFLPPYLQKMDYHDLYSYFYTPNGQFNTSWGAIANYWNDPYHRDSSLYGKNMFLLKSLNQGDVPSILYKENFMSIEQMHFFISPDDGALVPWDSAIFSSFAKDSESLDDTIPMFDQSFYIDDTFGLKTLYEAKRAHLHTVSGVTHLQWVKNQTIIETYVIPLLT